MDPVYRTKFNSSVIFPHGFFIKWFLRLMVLEISAYDFTYDFKKKNPNRVSLSGLSVNKKVLTKYN